MKSILDYIKVFKNIETYKGPGPQITAQEPRIKVAELTNMNTPDLEQSEFLRPGETLETWEPNPFLKPHAEGGRIGLLNGGDAVKLKAQTEFYDTYGKNVIDKASKQKHGVTFNKLKDKDKRANFKKKFKKEFEKSGTFMTEGESRKFFRQKRVLREQDIQIKLLDATNKKGKFNAAKFAKDNDISMKVLKEQSDLLQGNIYDKRMLVAGKEMRSTLTWIPEDATISDNALSKLHKSGLITYERTKIDELFYDAFGREYTKGTRQKNPAYNLKKYLAIKDNLNEYRQLKDAINAKYPSINFQLDHPLSKSTLNKIFNASADELTRVNILDASLNNSFKDSLSQKYENAISSKNFRAKKAVESIAKDLNLNIGKVSKNLTGYDYGVKEFQKLNIKDEIIKSLKNQKDLNYNFKNYIKNNPDLLKIAGFDDPSKIGTKLTKVTDKHIQGVEKILNVFCRKSQSVKAGGGRVGFGGECPIEDNIKYMREDAAKLKDVKWKSKNPAEAAKIAQKFATSSRAMLTLGKASKILFSPYILWGEPFFEAAFIAHDMLGNRTPWKEAVSKSYLTMPLQAMGLMKSSEEYQAADMIEVRDEKGNVTGIREGVKRYIDAGNRLSELDKLQNKVSNLEQQKETNVDLYGTDVYHDMLTDAKKELSGYASAIQREGGEQKFMRDMKLNEKAYREREEVMLTKRMEGKKYKEDPTRVFYELDDPRFKEMEEYKMGREDVTGFMSREDYEKLQESVPALKNIPYEDVPKFSRYTELLKQRMPGSYPGQRIGQVYSTPASRYGWDLTGEVARAGGVANMAGGGLANLTTTVAPDSGPMHQGLRSLYNNVKKS